MTFLRKASVLDRPRHAVGAVRVTRAFGGAAPALFRLLSDSALNRAALDVCGAPVAIADAAGGAAPLVYANPAFEALFRIVAADSAGRPLRELLGNEDPALDGWLPWGGEHARIEFAATRPDGSRFPVEAVAGEVRGTRGERTHWVLTFTDLERFATR